MSKTSKSFRLSDQALVHLTKLVEKTGSSETAIVELSLAYLSKFLSDLPSEKPVPVTVPTLPNVAMSQSLQSGKKRKRY